MKIQRFILHSELHLFNHENAIAMRTYIYFTLVLCLATTFVKAQKHLVKVVESEGNNRIAFYAENRSFTDYDVLFTVKGTNFRQSAAKPRWIRVPGASKVHLKTIVLMRDKKPLYTKALRVNDSLSRRALKKEFTVLDIPPPKIKPKKQITIYTSERCLACDTIVNQLNAKNFIFRSVSLDEKPEIKEQLGKFLAKSTEEMDTISTPILSLGGKLYSWISTYDKMMEEVEKE